MIRHIITGLVLGIFATLVFMQYDPWVHAQVGNLFIRALSQVFDCEVRGTVRTVNFLVPEIVFDDFAMIQKKDGEPDWRWTAKTYSTGFSWLDVVVTNSIKLWAAAHDLAVISKVIDNQLAIAPHIENLLAPPDLPIPLSVHDGYVKNGSITLEHDKGTAYFVWHATSNRLTNKSRTYVTILGGTVSMDAKRMLEYTSGTIVLDAYDDSSIEFKTDCQAQLCNLSAHPTVYCKGSWNNNSGRFWVESLDKSLHINPIIITQKQSKKWIELRAHMPASYLSFVATHWSVLNGNCSVSLKGTLDDPAFLDGHIVGENLTHALCAKPCMVSSTFHKRAHTWFGTMDVRLPENMMLRGSFKWDEAEDSGSVQLSNTTQLSLAAYPYWAVPKQEGSCGLQVDSQTICGQWAIPFLNHLHKRTIDAKGKLFVDRKTGAYSSAHTLQDFTFDCSGSFFAYPYINEFAYYSDKDNPAFTLHHNDNENRYEGMIKITAVRAFVHHFLGYDIQGEGAIEFRTQYNNSAATTQFHLRDGTIRLPQTFNFINGIDGMLSCDMATNAISLDAVSCRLHTGSLTIPHATVWLDSAGSISFCHAPLVFDHCLLNLKRDLFAVVSGVLTVHQQNNELPQIKGNLFLDRSQLKENIFSELFQKNLFQATDALHTSQGVALACDISVATKDAMRIDTGFLDAQAQINLSIKKQISEPEISGSISLLSGVLGFPYKPLHISRGIISFVKDQPLNPYIELVAKNRLRQHNIVLQVNGSLKDHFVLFESTPPLTDEQIIGLLLAGSHEESLSAVLPNLLVQNVTNIIFSADQSGFLDRYVKPWLKQVNVHFVPKFSEESGRGGLRGSLEIDVNERWRALIEKNFSLTEDTRFELEYLLSDDVRFRLIRDERCDVGTEVEMKWKF